MPAECKLHTAETDLTKAMHSRILDSEHKLYQWVYMKMLIKIVSSVIFLKYIIQSDTWFLNFGVIKNKHPHQKQIFKPIVF